MVSAIQIADDAARIYDKAAVATALESCRHVLPGAITKVWANSSWQVIEQAYDLPEVYMSYIEVQAKAPYVQLPIHCPRHDLYWLYLLHGAMAIAAADDQPPLVKTSERTYRISYLPAGEYSCRFAEGKHQLFYVVHKPTVLFREESPELPIQSEVIAALRARLATHATTAALSMRDGAAELIRRFLRAPGTTFLKRKQTVQNLSLDLIFHAHKSLGQHDGQRRVTAEWGGKMEQFIIRLVREGKPVNAETVAEEFNMSAAYVRKLFKAHGGETLGTYIRQRKLLLAEQLLDEGDTPSAVARYLGWTPAYFSRAFHAKFGYPPSQRGA